MTYNVWRCMLASLSVIGTDEKMTVGRDFHPFPPPSLPLSLQLYPPPVSPVSSLSRLPPFLPPSLFHASPVPSTVLSPPVFSLPFCYTYPYPLNPARRSL